jgi:hypothetical protein
MKTITPLQMMTSTPALHSWMPASLEVMNAVRS